MLTVGLLTDRKTNWSSSKDDSVSLTKQNMVLAYDIAIAFPVIQLC